MHRHELTDSEWERLRPLLPAERGGRGRPAMSMRMFLNAVLYIAKTGAPWRDLPARFGPWKTIHNRFSRWNARGVFDRVLAELSKNGADHESNIADSTYARAHQHAAGGKGGPMLSTLDALAAARPPSSTLSLTVSVIRSTSTSAPAISTTSPKHPPSSPLPKAKISSATRPTIRTRSSPPSKPSR
jgi:transposase